MTAVPGAREVREEDAFDVARVAEWLRTNAADPSGLESDPEVRQFSGGASNLTYLLRYPTRDLILRRAPRGTKAKGAHDMRREFTIQSALAPVFPYVAPMVGFLRVARCQVKMPRRLARSAISSSERPTISWMSAPAENAFSPDPVMTTARMSSSSSKSVRTSSSSATSA